MKFPPRRDVSQTHWEEGRLQNIYRKATTTTLKCIVLTFMAAFMWSRPLNSISWEITTQKKLKKKFDETNTQVVA